jgi:protein Tex
MLATEALLRISKEVGAPLARVETTISLLEGGATVPFIARYRKEATGNLDEVRIRDIDECRAYYGALEARRQTVLTSIEKQGKLTDDLKQIILTCFSKNELEDLYLPFKPKRKTKSNAALERGLGPLADYIWEQVGTEPVEVYAQQFVKPAEEVIAPSEVVASPEVAATPEVVAPPEVAATPEVVAPPEVAATPESDQSTNPPSDQSAIREETSAVDTAAAEMTVEVPTEAAPAPTPEPAPAPTREGPKPVTSVEEAIEGALHILAERVAETPDYRKQFRDMLLKEGMVRAHVVQAKESEKTKYEMYYKFEETVAKIPSHRILAIRRGTRENVLSYSIEADGEKFISAISAHVIKDATSQFAPFLQRAIRDGYDRLLAPSIQNEVRSLLRERGETEAIKVFEENLRTLLLAPPAGPIGVIGADPGMRTGCKIAVVDETGKFLENQTIFPTEPHKDLEGAEKILLDLVQKHNVRGIAIGNGTGSRETESFIRSVAQKNELKVFIVVVSEAGASVYSASKRAREEFPSLDVTVRGAISIARRLQDPLAELVKIEPRSIGVGQYQHDVDQKKLKHSLTGAVESCVNRVGVDLNTASTDLLKYVSGINDKLATAIVERRSQNGVFRSRTQLLEIDGFGDKTFEQAAGFLRIKDGENPLDRTAVHPESYPIVERMAASLSIPVAELIENPTHVHSIDFKNFENEAGRYTLGDIREELLKPGRDPRDKFVVPKFREDVREVTDLQEGMELEGSVTNVTNFGAFVDLGVHQDGLVHISELSHKYIQDAREAVKVGDIVKVKVIGVDPTMKRISLSMKAVIPKPKRRPRRKKKPHAAGAVQPGAQPTAQAPAAAAVASTTAERVERPPKTARPRPASPPRRDDQRKSGPPTPKPKPVETTAPSMGKQTMEEKIRALQEKFGRVG